MIAFFAAITFLLSGATIGVLKEKWNEFDRQAKAILIAAWFIFVGMSTFLWFVPFYKHLIS